LINKTNSNDSGIAISNRSGFSLVELMTVIAVIAILVLIAIPTFGGAMEKAALNTDKANVRILNGATSAYRIESKNAGGDVFSGISSDDDRIMTLVDNGYILQMIETKSEDAYFKWEISQQIWYLFIDSAPVMLTPFGNTFEDITERFIEIILENYEENGSYGRTWGDYRYTDLGIDPEEWETAITHFIYRPSGSQLLVTPEEGFTPTVETIFGEVRTVYDNYNIIYDTITEKWYWHSIKPENEIDISTLQLVPE